MSEVQLKKIEDERDHYSRELESVKAAVPTSEACTKYVDRPFPVPPPASPTTTLQVSLCTPAPPHPDSAPPSQGYRHADVYLVFRTALLRPHILLREGRYLLKSCA